jgi:hypothetical protein
MRKLGEKKFSLTKLNMPIGSEGCKQKEVKTVLLRGHKFKM